MARQSILLTRPEQDASRSASLIAGLGFQPVIAPMLTVSGRKIEAPGPIQAIVVTSGNALPALSIEALRHIKFMAVGDTTAARARAAGFTDVHSAGRDAAALARLVAAMAAPEGGPLLLATGAGQGAALAADLRSRGFRVKRRVCYATHPVRRFPPRAAQALISGELHAALFLSAETASAFVRLLPPELNHALAGVLALAIGKTTEDALLPLPWRGIRRAETPTLDDVLALI